MTTLKAAAMQVKAKRGNEKAITEHMQKAQQNKITFNEFVQQVRGLGGEVAFGELQAESEDTERITELLEQFNTGKLNIDTFIAKVREQGDKADFWNYEKDMNPQYIGNNKTSVGFRYNPSHHIKGKFYQHVIKQAERSAINFAHANIIKHYDCEAFIYDDERLRMIDEYCKKFIDKNFQNDYPYKADFMSKAVDLTLFNTKEDIYYTARWLAMLIGLAEMIIENKDIFTLTEGEKTNIEKWH